MGQWITSTVVAAVLRTINDETVVRAYGDGLLIDLPFTYGDGDAVRVLVDPMGTGVRVSDRAVAATLLSMAGADPRGGRSSTTPPGISDVLREPQRT